MMNYSLPPEDFIDDEEVIAARAVERGTSIEFERGVDMAATAFICGVGELFGRQYLTETETEDIVKLSEEIMDYLREHFGQQPRRSW